MILAPPGATLEEDRQRRNDAINAVTAYCNVEEGDMYGGRKRSGGRPKRVIVKKEESPSPENKALKAAMLSAYVKDPKERPTVCSMCLASEAALVSVRINSFSSPSDLSKHFKDNLKKVGEGEAPKCKLCNMALDHRLHLQNHAFRIHRTVS